MCEVGGVALELGELIRGGLFEVAASGGLIPYKAEPLSPILREEDASGTGGCRRRRRRRYGEMKRAL